MVQGLQLFYPTNWKAIQKHNWDYIIDIGKDDIGKDDIGKDDIGKMMNNLNTKVCICYYMIIMILPIMLV